MSDEKTEEAPKKAKKTDADAKMDGMNLEALHRKIELWGIAGILAPYAARNLQPGQLKLAVDKSMRAARDIQKAMDAEGTEGKA